MTAKLLIVGAAGRMGQRITDLAQKEGAWNVFYGLESGSKTSPLNVPCGSDRTKIAQADVLIDFTIAEATADLLADVVKAKKPYVIGTTGFSVEQEKKIAEAARVIPIVKSSNMSPGVNAFFKAAQQIAQALPQHAVHIQEDASHAQEGCAVGNRAAGGRLDRESLRNRKSLTSRCARAK